VITSIQTSQRKHLYVVKFQDQEVADLRPLTPFDQVEGWRVGEVTRWIKDEQRMERKQALINDRHQAGSIRTRTGPHILKWEVEPGETVVASLTVDFLGTLNQDDHDYTGAPITEGAQYYRRWTTWSEASVSPQVSSPAPDWTRYAVRIGSVLGRAVGLGEDGAEDAFGNDVLEHAIEHALEHALEGDWRAVQCGCELIPWPDGDTDTPEWAAWKKLTEQIKVKAREGSRAED
jgi:hypothetical protein